MTDTSEEILDIQRAIFAKKSADERFNIGAELIDFGRNIIIENIKKSQPDISEIDLKIEILKRYYENDFEKEEMALIIQSARNYFSNK